MAAQVTETVIFDFTRTGEERAPVMVIPVPPLDVPPTKTNGKDEGDSKQS